MDGWCGFQDFTEYRDDLSENTAEVQDVERVGGLSRGRSGERAAGTRSSCFLRILAQGMWLCEPSLGNWSGQWRR